MMRQNQSNCKSAIYKSTAIVGDVLLLHEKELETCIVNIALEDSPDISWLWNRSDIQEKVLAARWVRLSGSCQPGDDYPLADKPAGAGVFFLFNRAHPGRDLANLLRTVAALRETCIGEQSLTLHGPGMAEIEARPEGARACRTLIHGGVGPRKPKGWRVRSAGDPRQFDPTLLAAAFAGATAVRIAPVGELHRTGGRRGRPVNGSVVVRVHTTARMMTKWLKAARQYAPTAEISVPLQKAVRYRSQLKRKPGGAVR
jgi:hypothetical protein